MPLIELDRKIIFEQGPYRRTRFWYLGWVHTGHTSAQFIYSGIHPGQKETVITVDEIRATHTFDWAGVWTIKKEAA